MGCRTLGRSMAGPQFDQPDFGPNMGSQDPHLDDVPLFRPRCSSFLLSKLRAGPAMEAPRRLAASYPPDTHQPKLRRTPSNRATLADFGTSSVEIGRNPFNIGRTTGQTCSTQGRVSPNWSKLAPTR